MWWIQELEWLWIATFYVQLGATGCSTMVESRNEVNTRGAAQQTHLQLPNWKKGDCLEASNGFSRAGLLGLSLSGLLEAVLCVCAYGTVEELHSNQGLYMIP